MQPLNKKNFRTGIIISSTTAVALLIASFAVGKQAFFLLLNTDLGTFADYFFATYTYAGDALMWLPLLLIVIYKLKRKDALPLLISAFLICTILTQICKYLIVPDEPRPTKAIADRSLIHIVPNVELHAISSFPSGHTATAFCFYLIFCLLLSGSWWLGAGFILSLLVGYSRIYLAQHFPLDVAAGIIVAIVSVILALKFQQFWWKRKAIKNKNNSA
jgi:membrane-associated phospholipid phosphatase